MRGVRRPLLRPGWLVLHALVLVALVVMVRLGAWQWGRGAEIDSLRNYAYGLEWWVFAVLTVIGWVKFCYDETSEHPDADAAEAIVAAPAPAPVVVDAEDDPELAAWNAHLAELARRDAEQRR